LQEHNADGTAPDLQRAKAVRDWAAKQGVSVLHLALQFVLRERRVSTALVGASRLEEVEQNVRAATTPLPENLWRQLQDDLGIA
jgi:aryl-alcohol dehydrogenase-like predicted oxidoreductase